MKDLFCLIAAEHLSWWGRHVKGLCSHVRALSESVQLTSEEAEWNMQKIPPASASQAPPPRVPQPPQNSAPTSWHQVLKHQSYWEYFKFESQQFCKTCLTQPSVAWEASERQWLLVTVLSCCQIVSKICQEIKLMSMRLMQLISDFFNTQEITTRKLPIQQLVPMVGFLLTVVYGVCTLYLISILLVLQETMPSNIRNIGKFL